MGNFFSNIKISNSILCCTLVAFIFTSIAPIHAMQSAKESLNVNPIDINFGIRMEKLIEKSKKILPS